MKITEARIRQIIKEETHSFREAIDYDDPEYGADAEKRYQAVDGAKQFIEKFPKLKGIPKVEEIVTALYIAGFSILSPSAAALSDGSAERKARDETGFVGNSRRRQARDSGMQEGTENLAPEMQPPHVDVKNALELLQNPNPGTNHYVVIALQAALEKVQKLLAQEELEEPRDPHSDESPYDTGY
jgi:hypothetical protein